MASVTSACHMPSKLCKSMTMSIFGLEMKRDPFLFTEGKTVRIVLLTYTKDSPCREWIINRLTEPVMVMGN